MKSNAYFNGFVCIITLITMALVILISVAKADEIIIHPTMPGTTVRDYSQPSVVIDQFGNGYQTYPGTTVRDYGQPGFVIEGGAYERTIRNQYRIDQPLQQDMRPLWPAPVGD